LILRLSLDLPEDKSFIRTSRLLSRCLLEDIGVKRVIIEDVEEIVSELCSNVIRHSHGGKYLITLEYYQPKIVITVTDQGTGFNKAETPLPGTDRPDGSGGHRIGGFGIVLLEGLSDKIDFSETDPHGSTVRVEKNLLYDTPKDADIAAARDSNPATIKASTN
jgi:anti-sigma regulatory factor (Ser/Thr protein kinase)